MLMGSSVSKEVLGLGLLVAMALSRTGQMPAGLAWVVFGKVFMSLVLSVLRLMLRLVSQLVRRTLVGWETEAGKPKRPPGWSTRRPRKR